MTIQEIYDEAVKRLDGRIDPLHYGPAHTIWDDRNYDFAEKCIEGFHQHMWTFTKEQLDVVMWSLVELAKIPMSDREEAE